MQLIKNFKSLSKNDVEIAGGKGASLGEMTQVGIPVPPGYVILSEAFEKFINETDLNVEIDAALDEVNHEDVNSVDETSSKIQAIILSKAMPEDISKLIIKNFKELDAKFVAVRSSATSEDSADAVWAGQLDSFLNTTSKTLLENVKKCWASLFTPRAIFYRFEQKLHKKKISVAVVVQKMVESEVSGISFSVHPVTQDENQLIIEAGFGLGEAIVSGQITPDAYVFDKKENYIIDTNVDTILVDTNETQIKLPTNNIMGSSVKTDKDDEIDSIKSTVDTNLDVILSTRATPAQVNAEVIDVMAVDTHSEPSVGAPPTNPTYKDMINQSYRKIVVDKVTMSDTEEKTFMEDGATIRHKRGVTKVASLITKAAATA